MRVLLCTGATACGCLLVAALALAFADLAMSRPRAALRAWQQHAPLGDHVERRRLLARMGRALAVNPLDADQRMDLGRFFVWHAERHAADAARARVYRRLAADRFEEAVRARPTSAFAWVLLAEQWSRLGIDEARVRAALRRGAALGPMEPGVQLKVLWLGLARWPALAAGERAALRDSLERLLRSPVYFRTAAGIALQHGRGDLLRAASTADWQRRDLARMRPDGAG